MMGTDGSRALIGSTGFVGGALLRQTRFDALFSSSNIESIRGRHFDLLICAGVAAEKWKANLEPEEDWRRIRLLLDNLAASSVGELLLISTTDVYPTPVRVDEDTEIDKPSEHAYGHHRLMVEREIASRHSTRIVRLPALFGAGLKKNAVYDLVHGHRVEFIHPGGVFQFYSVDWLWKDLRVVLQSGLPLVNFATEPVSICEVAREVFSTHLPGRPDGEAPDYDMRTKYARLFGGSGPYLRDRAAVFEALREFARSEAARSEA